MFKRFASLFAFNFVGVFNDNFLKHLIIYVAVLWSAPTCLTQSTLISLVGAMMVIPYLIFSPLASVIIERYSKISIIKAMKIAELPIVLLALGSFYFENVWVALVAVLLMGTQSCFYSPAKYALIPDVAGKEGVAFGSGFFEAMAFLGILIGTIAAAVISDNYSIFLAAAVLLTLCGIGILLAYNLKIKESETPQEATTANPIKFIYNMAKECRYIKNLNTAIYGASLLWLVGGMLQMNLVLHSVTTLQMTNSLSGLLLATAAVGIAVGTAVVGMIAKPTNYKKIILLGVGLIIISLFYIILFKPYWTLFVAVLLIAFGGAAFQVPCLTIIQSSECNISKSTLISYLNLLTFIFVLLGTAIFYIITLLTHENSYAVFVAMAVMMLLSLIPFVRIKKIES